MLLWLATALSRKAEVISEQSCSSKVCLHITKINWYTGKIGTQLWKQRLFFIFYSFLHDMKILNYPSCITSFPVTLWHEFQLVNCSWVKSVCHGAKRHLLKSTLQTPMVFLKRGESLSLFPSSSIIFSFFSTSHVQQGVEEGAQSWWASL